jgi:Major Facilitator Superfamily
MWYRRAEAQKRFSFFFSSTTLAGAFGGLLASAIGKMEGIRGYRGWRWIFILEGVLTCVVAIFFWFLLPDFPEDAKWLKEDERAYVKARLEVDQGKSALDRSITFKDVVNVFKDYKIIVGGFMYFGLIVPVRSRQRKSKNSADPSSPGVRICIFRTKHHPHIWIFPDPDAALFRPTMGCCLRFLDVGRLGLGQIEASLSLHTDPHRHRHCRICHASCRVQQPGCEICGPLPCDMRLLLGDADYCVLGESKHRRAPQTIGWQRLADRVRQHWRDHRDLCVPTERCAAV